MCVSGFGFCFHPANPGWGVGVRVLVCVLRLYPANPGWGLWCLCLGSGFGFHPANPGWGVGVCVFVCVSACTPPVLAGVCGVGVCAWVRVSAAPRHSWLGCWGVCVFVCALRLYPANPGWGLWCVCVCLGFGFHPANPGWGVGVCVFVCALRLYPANPGWGVRCGCVCLGLGFGCAPPFLAGVLGCVCLCARSACTPPILAGVLGCGCVCLGLGFGCAPPFLAGVLGCVCLCARSACTPPILAGVLGCVCLCARSACTPPILAGVCGVGVCAWVRVSAAPRHSWLGCWGVCVFVCALRLYPANPGWGLWCVCVCLGFGFHPANPGWGVGVCVFVCVSACTPPVLAGVCGVGVRAWVRVSAAPRHSWLGCWGVYVFVCALRLYPANPGWGLWCVCVCLGFGFHPANPGWGVGVCVFVCVSACTPPILAGVCGVGVCAWVRVSAAPRHSWLGCWGVCVFVCALRLYPANPGWGLWCVCVCLGFGFHPANPGWGVGVCVFVCALRLYPANPGWGVRCGCVCLGSGFGCAPPFLAGVLWCVCLCARSTCTPPILAGVLGCGCVCVWVLAFTPPSGLFPTPALSASLWSHRISAMVMLAGGGAGGANIQKAGKKTAHKKIHGSLQEYGQQLHACSAAEDKIQRGQCAVCKHGSTQNGNYKHFNFVGDWSNVQCPGHLGTSAFRSLQGFSPGSGKAPFQHEAHRNR